MDILDETDDLELVASLVETLMIRIDDVGDYLMDVEYQKASLVLKRHIIMVLAYSERSKCMQFLLDEYFYHSDLRSLIRQAAFKNKKFLFMNLVRYFESQPFKRSTVETAQQILKTIPRDVILSCVGNSFNGARLLDVYYAIPVNEREKWDD